MNNPDLSSCIEKLLPILGLFTPKKTIKKDENTEIFELASRLSELEGYIYCVQQFQDAFSRTKQDLQSSGLRSLQKYIHNITENEYI